MKLPVIVERNAWTLPQERYNAEWVLENGVGMVLPGFRDIARAVRDCSNRSRFATVRSAVEKIETARSLKSRTSSPVCCAEL